METYNTIVTAGNTGKKIRSECFVRLELTQTGGIQLNLKSKVIALYEKAIRDLILDVIRFFDIQNAKIDMEDTGALPWTMAARLEAAIKQVLKTDREYLLPMPDYCLYTSTRERFRFSRLYLPGNTPNLMINAGLHGADGIILDLEDAVAPQKKDEARLLVRNILRGVNFYGSERMVRINQGQRGIEDLAFVVPHNVHLILVPKCEAVSDIQQVEEEIDRLKALNHVNHEIYLMPIIESALGVERAFDIAVSSKKIVALAIGLEDFTADLGVKRTKEANESLYARTRLVNACHAAKIQAIDSVFSDVGDMEGLLENVKMSKSLGFEGMGCIHPRQVPVIKEGFSPSADEIEKAKKIVFAAFEAEKQGLGVVALGTKMIDPPVVKRHMKIIDLAINLGIVNKEWREEYVEQLS